MTSIIKRAAQDWMMHSVKKAICELPSETTYDLALRRVAVEQFRRIEKLFRYEPGSWSSQLPWEGRS